MAQVRHIVNDVDEAVEFYTSKLDFSLEQQASPGPGEANPLRRSLG